MRLNIPWSEIHVGGPFEFSFTDHGECRLNCFGSAWDGPRTVLKMDEAEARLFIASLERAVEAFAEHRIEGAE